MVCCSRWWWRPGRCCLLLSERCCRGRLNRHRFMQSHPSGMNRLLRKSLRRPDVTSVAEAAVDCVALTARLEDAPFQNGIALQNRTAFRTDPRFKQSRNRGFRLTVKAVFLKGTFRRRRSGRPDVATFERCGWVGMLRLAQHDRSLLCSV